MLTVLIVSIGILAFTSGLRYLAQSIRMSRGRGVATDLAQDRMQKFFSQPYTSILVSTSTASDANFTPAVEYDNVSYPPEQIVSGGVTYTRMVYIANTSISGNVISSVGGSAGDSGLKMIRVIVKWKHGDSWKKVTVNSLYENPYLKLFSGTVTGTVMAGGSPVEGALVYAVQNANFSGQTDSSGDFGFGVQPATYSVRASSVGFLSATINGVSVSSGQTVALAFTLTRIASGTVTGSVWYNPDLVISQVVASTATQDGQLAAKTVEYVELYNPTTGQIDLAAATGHNPSVVVNVAYDDPSGVPNDFCATTDRGAVYVSSYVAAGRNFLIANTSFFMVLGSWVSADAYWGTGVGSPDGADKIKSGEGGSVYLRRGCAAANVDAVSWEGGGTSPSASLTEGAAIDLSAYSGIGAGKQIVRVSSPLVTSSAYGRAYDSGSNDADFDYEHAGWTGNLAYAPRTTASAAVATITGKPVPGALVSGTDLIGNTTASYLVTVASNALSLPIAKYELDGVSTGTWEVFIASSIGSAVWFQQVSTITVAASASTGAPNGATVPSWTAPGLSSVKLSSETSTTGFIYGFILNGSAQPLGNILVNVGGSNVITSPNGRYFAAVSTGSVLVSANPNNANPQYVEERVLVTVDVGQLVSQNITLNTGGVLRGYVTSGLAPLRNQAFVAKIGAIEYGQASSDGSGAFNIRNLPAATYDVTPVTDEMDASVPASASASVLTGQTVWVATFTISNAFGTISGQISSGGPAALIVASTASIAGAPHYIPRDIVASTAPASQIYYSASSGGDGSYRLNVRGGFSYYLHAYVPVISGETVRVTTHTYSGIAVTPAGSTTRNIP